MEKIQSVFAKNYNYMNNNPAFNIENYDEL